MTARRVSDLLTGNNNNHLTRFLALATQQCAHREPVFTALLPQEVCLRCLGMKVDNISKGRMMSGLGCTQGVFHNRGSELSDRLIFRLVICTDRIMWTCIFMTRWHTREHVLHFKHKYTIKIRLLKN